MMVHCIQVPETKSMHLCLMFAFPVNMSINTGSGKVSERRLGILSSPYSAINGSSDLCIDRSRKHNMAPS